MAAHDDETKTTDAGVTIRKPAGSRVLLVLGEGEPQVFTLPDAPQVTVGRGREADVRIEAPSLSRVHARVTFGMHITLEDLGSSNGTRVSGLALEPNRAVVLSPGSSIQFGGVLAVLHVGDTLAPTLLGTSDGSAAGAQALEHVIARVAAAELAVLLVGETGTGKGVLARRIHDASPRASDPFVVFTGASHPSDIAASVGGTLVLDEFCDLALAPQRVLVAELDRMDRRPRIIGTSRRDVARALEEGAVLPELYHRVNGVTIVVPPLRERVHEIAGLATTFAVDAAKAAGRLPPVFAPDALAILERHPWPGNVRELESRVRQSVTLASGRVLTGTHFADLGGAPSEGPARGGALRQAREQAEYQRIIEALRTCRGNQTRAAEMLGISRGTLLSRLEKYGVPRPRKS